MVSTLQNIEFVTTAASEEGLPPAHGTEVAFVGRSNAGKSSAINALARRKRMAFASKTPGCTQHINFFRVAPECYLVDLPGYGYAAVPAQERANWQQFVAAYLQRRANLKGVVLIMDARHPFTQLDRQLLAWMRPSRTPLHVLLSKCDKLARREAQATLARAREELERAYDADACSVQLFSSTRSVGIHEAAAKILAWLAAEEIKNPR